jgi:hypothetical protein
MKKNTLIKYGEAIKAKYEEVKYTDSTGFLYNPSPANLKQLCLLLFDDLAKNDWESYNRFFIFKAVANPRKHIENFDTDKFRPLRNFLLGSSEKSSQNNLDLLAVLVNHKPRPFNDFIKDGNHILQSNANTYTNAATENINVSEPIIPEYGNKEIEAEPANDEVVENEDNKVDDGQINEKQNSTTSNTINTFNTTAENKHYSFTLKANRIKLVPLVLLVFVAIAFIAKTTFFNDEGCMLWKDDHYETTPCETQIKNFVAIPIVHLDKETLALQKKIKPCDTTTFFVNGKPVVWYCKMQNGTVEYFSYPGLHPVTGETLKHITRHIISKYAINKK